MTHDPVQLEPAGSAPIVLPQTGEVFDLAVPAKAGEALLAIDDAIDELRQLRAVAVDVLWDESRRQGTKTLHFDRFDVEVWGDTKTEYDPVLLRELLEQADLPGERLDALIKTRVEYVVDGRVVRQLVTNPLYAAALEQAKTVRPVPRGAKAKR